MSSDDETIGADTFDLVVVGGGLAGLATAALAAQRGARVAVVERQGAPGGRAASERTPEGFVLNRGAHALYRGGPAARVLAALGVAPRGRPPRVTGYAVHRGALHAFPAGPVSLMTTGLLNLSARLEVAGVLARAGRIEARAAALARTTAREFIASEARTEGARALLTALVRVSSYCTDDEALSGEVAAIQLARGVRDGVIYLDDGWQSLVDALRARLDAAGGTLIVGDAARELEQSGGAVRAVRLASGRRLGARAVALCTGPRAAASLAGDAAAGLARAARDAVPVRAACLDLALARLPRPAVTFALGIDAPVYLSVHSAAARLVPAQHPGGAVVHLLRYLRGDEPAGEGTGHIAELEALMDRVQPGWRAHVLARRALPSMVVANARDDAAAGGLGARPAVAVPEIAGLYVAGDWVGAEGSLADASFASAEAVAARVAPAPGARDDTRRRRAAAAAAAAPGAVTPTPPPRAASPSRPAPAA